MSLKDALQIVVELAEQNVIDDPEMKAEAKRQREAIRKVARLIPVVD